LLVRNEDELLNIVVVIFVCNEIDDIDM